MKTSIQIKKVIALLFAVIIFGGGVSAQLQTNAVSPVQLSVTNASGKAGDDVTVSVNISANSGLAAGTLLLKYDTAKLAYKIQTYGPAQGQLNGFNENYENEGDIRTIYYAPIHTDGITAGGAMLNVTFTLKTGWAGSTPLTLTVTEFLNSSYNEIEKTISNGSMTITTTTTKPSTTIPVTTTKPSTPTTKPATSALTTATTVSNGQIGTTGITSSVATIQTTAPVSVPVDDVIEALGTDAAGWDKNISSLNEEQKERIEEHFAEAGTPVIIQPDGIYYMETTETVTLSSENDTESVAADDVGMTSKTKAIAAVSIVLLILATALCIAYFKRKKSNAN